MKFGNSMAITYLEGMLGCFGFTFLFLTLSCYHNERLRDVGMNTLTILGFHTIFIQIFRFAYKHIASGETPIWYLVVVAVVSFVLCYLLALLIKKYCPIVVGAYRNRK